MIYISLLGIGFQSIGFRTNLLNFIDLFSIFFKYPHRFWHSTMQNEMVIYNQKSPN